MPEHIKKIEADLKKEWNKKQREAKKVMKAAPGSAAAAAAPAKGTKRKAEQASTNVNVNVSVQTSHTGAVKVDTAQPTAKRAKASGSSSTSTTSKKTTNRASKAKKTTTSAPNSNSTQVSGFASRSSQGGHEYYPGGNDVDGYGSYTDPPQSEYFDPQPSPRRSLGILNGRYEVSCPLLEDNPPEYMNDCALIATLDGYSLWLKFDFGPATGLIKVERPYEASGEATMAFWRGFALDRYDNRRFFNIDTVDRAGPVNRLCFLGGGHIEGMITYDGVQVCFDAYRLPGQSMTSELSPSQARDEWARLEQNMDTDW